MKKQQVKVGGTYSAKITDKVVPVRIDKERAGGGGWDATNLHTNRKVHIKSAQKLRSRITVPPKEDETPATKQPAKKKLTAAERKALVAKHKADQENARLRDERAKSDDGMTASERAMAKSADDTKRGKKKAKATPKEKPPVKPKKLSLIDAAVQVLAESKEPLNCKQMVEQVTEKKLWSSDGKTPHATLYSAILREISTKGNDARFKKVDRGQFTLAKKG